MGNKPNFSKQNDLLWWVTIVILVVLISFFHYSTSTMKWQYHLVFMQSYFIPILIAALQFGIRGGFGTAMAVSIIYFPHIMLQWGGLVETNLMRFLQIALFNIIGYLVGWKAQAEKNEKEKYRRTAEELKISMDKLKQQSDKLSELEQQLRFADRLSVVGELSASLAHEVRNPLGAIRGATEILRDELTDNSNLTEFLQILVQETERLNKVLENYLSFARVKTQHVASFDLNEVIYNITQMMQYSAKKADIEFDIHLPRNSILLEGDPTHFRQILTNLLLNAIQAMTDGGTITLTAEKNSDDDSVRLQVKDNGPGIDKENLKKIFKPFYTTKPTGTGLGLAIVKRLADENHWQLTAESRLGSGASFHLIIPLAKKV